jgi:lambda family phage portal protein
MGIGQLIDSAISTVNPEWGVRRAKARAMLAFSGGYHGGSLSRQTMAGFLPANLDADTSLSPALPLLRSRSRDLARNSPVALGALNTMVTNVIGTGLSLQCHLEPEALGLTQDQVSAWQTKTQRLFRIWAESTDCDATRTQSFYELQSLAFRSLLESGDVFALMPNLQRQGRDHLAVQLIEADRISNPDNGIDSGKLIGGIRQDDWGAPVTYYVCNRHPGAFLATDAPKWQPVPAFGANTGRRNILHLFERRRPGQSRGIPYLAPVIEPLKQLARYTDAELQAAVVAGAFAVFIKMDPNAFQDIFDDTGRTQYLASSMGWNGSYPVGGMEGPGKAVNLLPGESIEASNPGRPNAEFDPFVQAILRQIGVALELPFEVLIKHFQSSYSAARAALLDAWRLFRTRREIFSTQFCQPIYEEWLYWEIASGRISAPGYLVDPTLRALYNCAQWVGDGPGSIDPEKEVNAAILRIDTGISTLSSESILYDGQDWESKNRQRQRETQARRDAGLELPPQAAPSKPNPSRPQMASLANAEDPESNPTE